MTQDRELLEDVFENLQGGEEKKQNKRAIALVILALMCVGLYVFFLLFGSNSWSALLKIKEQKMRLEEQAKRLQQENVELQKFIFELKGLEPTHEENG